MVNFILLSFFHLFLIAFLLHAMRTHKSFDALAKIFIFLILVHCSLIYLEIGTPLVLLYGPMVLGLQHQMKGGEILKKSSYLHLLPFLVMIIFYSVLYYTQQFNFAQSESLLIYYPIYFFCMAFSLIAYGMLIWLEKEDVVYNRIQQQLVLHLSALNFITAIFISILFASFLGKLDIDKIGFNSIYIIYGLLFISILILTIYLASNSREALYEFDNRLKVNTLDRNPRYNAFTIEIDVLNEYVHTLENIMKDKKIYLKSGLSLEELSIETGIPKHHFSQLFNVYLGKTFYQYIAEYRIKEAVFRINSDENITIESLAFECGFNSKTSFNKYFKKITTITPSEYRAKSETLNQES